MTTIETQAGGSTKQRVELARYSIGSTERVIYGQRILGVVRLVDEPAEGGGRRYIIERGLRRMAELEAVVADYLAQSRTWQVIPAAGSCPLQADAREAGR